MDANELITAAFGRLGFVPDGGNERNAATYLSGSTPDGQRVLIGSATASGEPRFRPPEFGFPGYR